MVDVGIRSSRSRAIGGPRGFARPQLDRDTDRFQLPSGGGPVLAGKSIGRRSFGRDCCPTPATTLIPGPDWTVWEPGAVVGKDLTDPAAVRGDGPWGIYRTGREVRLTGKGRRDYRIRDGSDRSVHRRALRRAVRRCFHRPEWFTRTPEWRRSNLRAPAGICQCSPDWGATPDRHAAGRPGRYATRLRIHRRRGTRSPSARARSDR